jgi:hypothetical protein
MEKEIKYSGITISHGNVNITPVIRLHLHCFNASEVLAFHTLIEPVYVILDYAGTSRIFHITGEEISVEQFNNEVSSSSIT